MAKGLHEESSMCSSRLPLVLLVMMAITFIPTTDAGWLDCYETWSRCSKWSRGATGILWPSCMKRCKRLGFPRGGRCVLVPSKCPLTAKALQCRCLKGPLIRPMPTPIPKRKTTPRYPMPTPPTNETSSTPPHSTSNKETSPPYITTTLVSDMTTTTSTLPIKETTPHYDDTTNLPSTIPPSNEETTAHDVTTILPYHITSTTTPPSYEETTSANEDDTTPLPSEVTSNTTLQ